MPTKVCVGGAMTLCQSKLEREITEQVMRRGAGKTICPSEVARALSGDWRALMPEVRDAGAEMAARGEIVVTQKGVVVDLSQTRGPVRFGLPG